jgi:single-strand selective monofunctional uracil DNA glycosylase
MLHYRRKIWGRAVKDENPPERRRKRMLLAKPGAVGAQLEAAAALRERMEDMVKEGVFAALKVYNPLTYAWRAFEEYVARYGGAGTKKRKRVLFLGMNPGPWGMAQTGVPFGEVAAVRDWLGITAPVGRPAGEHPSYPVDGYACKRSEVSGKRLWGLFAERFGSAEVFFEEHFVANYCPLLFIETAAAAGNSESNSKSVESKSKLRAHNLTPDRLPASVRAALYEACDAHLRALAEALAPRYVIGIGRFAAARAEAVVSQLKVVPEVPGAVTVGKILHPSPASPRSNINWAVTASCQLAEQGIWEE